MNYCVELAAEYSTIVAPGLSIWAGLLLHMQPRNCNCSVVQGLYFFSLLFVSVLTIRATMNHDTGWLVNAASLGILIVLGVLKRPVADLDSWVVNSEA